MQFPFFQVNSLVYAIIALVLGIIMIVVPRVVAYLIGAFLIFIAVMFFVQTYIL